MSVRSGVEGPKILEAVRVILRSLFLFGDWQRGETADGAAEDDKLYNASIKEERWVGCIREVLDILDGGELLLAAITDGAVQS